MPDLFRVILPVGNIDAAARYYGAVLASPGQRISPGRHYFSCGSTILACYDPIADGDEVPADPRPHPKQYVYFSTQDLDDTFERARGAGGREVDTEIATRPWGERSFYAVDPFGNRICFVDAHTLFLGHPPQPNAPPSDDSRS
jgi:predicted enzyme related to lactoylglutathione lyase